MRDARRHLAQECELGLLNQGALELYLVGNELAQFDSRCQLLRQQLERSNVIAGKLGLHRCYLEHGDNVTGAPNRKLAHRPS